MTVTTTTIPQREGEFAPVEAAAWESAVDQEPNRAGDEEIAARSLKYVTDTVTGWSELMRPLHRRWRATNYMLSGNTLDRQGPEDCHVPEIYKAIETLVPRIEEAILEKAPWFRVVPRRATNENTADTVAAYIDWQFAQANVPSMIQSAIRNLLVTQAFAFHTYWDNRRSMRTVREKITSFDKNGRLQRKIKSTRKEVIDYSGPVVQLVDPFDFIIDTKATTPQNAIYVGHRAFVTIDEIERLGKQFGWANLDKLKGRIQPNTTFGLDQDYYKWTRDPTARAGDPENRYRYQQGSPEKIELVVLYGKSSVLDGENYEDVRFIAAGGRAMLEVKKNPYDGQFRPYATGRATKSGHEFYGIGPLDNAIRLNQYADRLHQILLKGAAISGCPFAFIEDEDGEFPDSLYKLTPGKVFSGVSNVRFSQVPDGFLRSLPMAIEMLQRKIEEVTGAFRIQMGQDMQGGTATEATLSLQEGNRRTRGLIRAVGDGLEQLLENMYRHNQQESFEDVEFPVLGKRGLDMRKTHVTISPADMLDDVKFDLVGLHSLRTYGLKATGLTAFANSMAPFIVANPTAVDQVGLMHEFASELIGPDEADRLVKVPTPIDKLVSQELENEILLSGTEVEVDPDDDDPDHLEVIEPLYRRAIDKDSDMQAEVRRVTIQHRLHHLYQMQQKQAQEKALRARQPAQMLGMPPPEAGGTQGETGSSPKAGGMSNALEQTGEPGGQTPMENPGPADTAKYSRSGRAARTTNQTENA